MRELTRRRMLAVAGASGVVAAAGCSSSADEGDDEEDGPTGTKLGEIMLENVDDAEHTIDVLVEFGDEIQHWSTHQLGASGDGTTLDGDWSTDPGEFRVTVRIDEGEFTQVTPARWNEPACLNLLALVERDGQVRVLSDTDGGPCGSGETDFEDGE